MKIKQTEKQIENSILKYLEAKGYYAIKHQRTGLYDPIINKFRCTKNRFHRKGIADIQFFYADELLIALEQCKTIFLEVKTSIGRQSKDQKQFQKDVEKSGCIYRIVRNIDDVEKLLKEFN